MSVAQLAMANAASLQALPSRDWVMLIGCLALAAATLVYIFLIDPDASDSAPHRSRLDQLLERRDAIYENLRDLKFEHRSGKFSEGDFEQTKQALETEAGLVLAEIEKTTGATARPARRDPSTATSAEKPAT